MTLENTVLEKLTEWRPPEGRQTLTAQADGWQTAVTAERRDGVGCLLWQLTVRRLNLVEGGDVRAWAEAVAGRSAGLLEDLKVLEIDDLRREGLLRSDSPAQKGDKLFYYELLLRGTNEAVLRRYEGGHNGTHREQVPFALTHEAIARVAHSLVGAK